MRVDFEARPAFDPAAAHEAYILLLRAATSAGLSDSAFERCRRAAAQSLPGDKTYFAIQARGNSLAHRDWVKLDERRRQMRLAWRAFFADYDLMLCPVAATVAFQAPLE